MTEPTASDLMTCAVVTIVPDMPVTLIARLPADRGISGVPMLDAEGALPGLVRRLSRTTAMRAPAVSSRRR